MNHQLLHPTISHYYFCVKLVVTFELLLEGLLNWICVLNAQQKICALFVAPKLSVCVEKQQRNLTK